MEFRYNKFAEIEEPRYILCKASGERLGEIKCTKKNYIKKLNDYDEISFTTYMMYDNEKNSIYDSIVEMQYVEIPDIGRFIIETSNISGEASDFEYKQCTALSEEVIMAQKYLELFSINLGTTESINNVSLYNLSNPNQSLLHLVLEKCPDWRIGHVDTSLQTKQRSFEVSRQDVYSFLVNDVSTAFECIFEFDALRHEINVYDEEIGTDTQIIVSYDNLLKNVSISSSIDDIKTCLTITGSDNLDIRDVNMGYDKIYMLDYFHSLEYMSKNLYNSYAEWKEKWSENLDVYEELRLQYRECCDQISYIRSEKMPEDAESTDWTEYGLIPLQEQLASYKQKQDLMIKKGQANKDHVDYQTMYLPCYNTIEDIEKQINIVKDEIEQIESRKNTLSEEMSSIINNVSMKNNFSTEELSELTKFIREEELSSSNFVVTDTMTEAQRIDMLRDMLEYGKKELAKKAQPTISFSADIVNLYDIHEFKNYCGDFDTGNYIHVILRDDYIIKSRILSIDFDFIEHNISPTFGSLFKIKEKGIFSDVTEAVSLAQSAATSVSFNSSHWSQASKDSTSISKMLSDGLLAAGQALKTSNSDLVVDERGVFVNNTTSSEYPNDGIFIGGGQILFTDDGFASVKTALGRITYTKNGVDYSTFGLLADVVLAGYVGGSTIEGSEIIGGTITGSEFNNGNGTFSVDSDGNLIATSGAIGGWTIGTNKIYAGSPDDGEKVAVMQKPRDGIQWVFAAGGSSHSSYSDCPFRVSKDGILYATDAVIEGKISATKGKFGGINISQNKIYSDNNNLVITSDGYATLKDVSITGVHTGSSFGGVTYSSSGTYGGFNNGFSAGTSFGLSGGARSDFDELVANKVTADYIDAKVQLSAKFANINNILAGNVVASNLKVSAANVTGALIANKVSILNGDMLLTLDNFVELYAIRGYNENGSAIIKKVKVLGVEVSDTEIA